MAAEILPGITDDNDFIKLLNSMLGRLLVQESPKQLWIIQIDNWFDHKWLRFSGKGAVDFQFPEYMNRFDGALEEVLSGQDYLSSIQSKQGLGPVVLRAARRWLPRISATHVATLYGQTACLSKSSPENSGHYQLGLLRLVQRQHSLQRESQRDGLYGQFRHI